jgi:hypothetical protein
VSSTLLCDPIEISSRPTREFKRATGQEIMLRLVTRGHKGRRQSEGCYGGIENKRRVARSPSLACLSPVYYKRTHCDT